MPFDLKKSLSDWKSAKPLLMLRKTGVTELLHSVPEEPTTIAGLNGAKKECETIAAKLEAISNGASFKSEKKARQGLSVLTLRISAYAAELNARLTTLNGARIKIKNELDTMAREGDAFHQLYTGDKLKIQDVIAYAGRLQTQYTNIYNTAMQAKINANWLGGFHNFSQTLTAPFNKTILPAMRTLAPGKLGGHTTLPGISQAMTDLHTTTSKIAERLEAPVAFTS